MFRILLNIICPGTVVLRDVHYKLIWPCFTVCFNKCVANQITGNINMDTGIRLLFVSLFYCKCKKKKKEREIIFTPLWIVPQEPVNVLVCSNFTDHVKTSIYSTFSQNSLFFFVFFVRLFLFVFFFTKDWILSFS